MFSQADVAFMLGTLILICCPVCSVVFDSSSGRVVETKRAPTRFGIQPDNSGGGEIVYEKWFSTLEISGMAALRTMPAARPAVQAALFVGAAATQLNKIGIACYEQNNHPDCNRSLLSFGAIWQAADIPEEDLDAWRLAVGDKHGLVAAACAAVNLGGLTGLFFPDRIATGGLLALLALLQFTPLCILDWRLLLMCVLGVVMVLPKER